MLLMMMSEKYLGTVRPQNVRAGPGQQECAMSQRSDQTPDEIAR